MSSIFEDILTESPNGYTADERKNAEKAVKVDKALNKKYGLDPENETKVRLTNARLVAAGRHRNDPEKSKKFIDKVNKDGEKANNNMSDKDKETFANISNNDKKKITKHVQHLFNAGARTADKKAKNESAFVDVNFK